MSAVMDFLENVQKTGGDTKPSWKIMTVDGEDHRGKIAEIGPEGIVLDVAFNAVSGHAGFPGKVFIAVSHIVSAQYQT